MAFVAAIPRRASVRRSISGSSTRRSTRIQSASSATEAAPSASTGADAQPRVRALAEPGEQRDQARATSTPAPAQSAFARVRTGDSGTQRAISAAVSRLGRRAGHEQPVPAEVLEHQAAEHEAEAAADPEPPSSRCRSRSRRARAGTRRG